MPTQLSGVGVSVNGQAAFIYFYCSAATDPACPADQINALTPLDSTLGPDPVVVTNNGVPGVAFTANMTSIVPSFLLFDSTHVVATHVDGARVAPPGLIPGVAFTPAQPGELVIVYAIGLGLPTTSLVNGSATQTGSLPAVPECQIAGTWTSVVAALVSPGLYQLNVTVPTGTPNGDNPISCNYNGASTPEGDVITVQQ